MSAAEAVTPTGPFSPSTLSVFSQLLAGYNLNAAADNFEEQAGVIAVARRELTDAILASGMVAGAGPNALEAPAEATPPTDDLPGLRLVDDPPKPNRAARRAKPLAAKSTPKKAAAPRKR